MSITGALSNALTGLRAAGRGVELVSSNVANATTKGYGRRLLELSTSALGGIRIDGVNRAVNEGLIADRRTALSANEEAKTVANFLTRLSQAIGDSKSSQSISGSLARFENSLISSASRPDAPERIIASIEIARDLANSISKASEKVQEARSTADRAIDHEVERLNSTLKQVEQLNSQIASTLLRGESSASLQDHRQVLIDEIASIVPINLVSRSDGQVGIYSTGGAILLDGSAQEIGFSAVNTITPYQTIGNGQLSGLTIGGIAIGTNSEDGSLSGGSLGAHFKVRDELGEQAQSKLDAIARDLIERFQDPSIDPSLAIGDAGLFTDNGTAFDVADEPGISARISVNAAVDPSQSGEAYRFRDGIKATAPGPVGDASLLNSLISALGAARLPASGSFGSGTFSSSGLVSSYSAEVGSHLVVAEQQLTFASTRLQETTERQLADGVDTDAELQNLLVLERAYAANAKVIQSVDEMMQSILRI